MPTLPSACIVRRSVPKPDTVVAPVLIAKIPDALFSIETLLVNALVSLTK